MLAYLMQQVEVDHLQAMEKVDLACSARRAGDLSTALQLFLAAYELEKRAAEALSSHLEMEPTRSILYRSAAALALEAEEEREAERLACKGLSGEPPREIAYELREI